MSIAELFAAEVSDIALDRGYAALRRLAHWWLTPDALRRVGREFVSPRSDIREGEFIVLLHRKQESAVLERGLALPLRWFHSRQDDPRLPTALRSLAEEIKSHWRGADARNDVALWLGEDCPDLRTFEIMSSSAELMLAAALRATDRSFVFDQRVTASASIRKGVLAPVDGLEAKRAIAAKLGMQTIFVARGQEQSPSTDAACCETQTRELDVAELDRQIESMVLALDAPPTAGSLDARCAWYHRHIALQEHESRAASFFCDAIAEPLATEAHARSAAPCPLQAGMHTMVSIATGRWESAVFAAHFLHPSRIVVLHDTSDNGTNYARRTAEALLRFNGRWTIECLAWVNAATASYESLIRTASQRLQAVAADDARQTCVDLTGGTTLMKLALSEVALRRHMHRVVTDSIDHAKGRTNVRILRVITIPHRDGG